MRTVKTIAGGALLVVLAASTASAQVRLSMRDARMTLVATNATARQILTEWARIGQTKIVNLERIPGGPLTLQFTNMPEQEVLEILLRSVAGYMAAPQSVAVASLSYYDRILVLPTAATPRVPSVAAAPTPVLQRPPVPQPAGDDSDDEPSLVQPPRGPLFPTFQPAPVNPQQNGVSATPGTVPQQPALLDPQGQAVETPETAQPGAFPGAAAVGTPRPGMVVQPPGQPGLILPGQIGQPVPAPDN